MKETSSKIAADGAFQNMKTTLRGMTNVIKRRIKRTWRTLRSKNPHITSDSDRRYVEDTLLATHNRTRNWAIDIEDERGEDNEAFSSERRFYGPSNHVNHQNRSIERVLARIRTNRAPTNSIIISKAQNLLSKQLRVARPNWKPERCTKCREDDYDEDKREDNLLDTSKHRVFHCNYYNAQRLGLYQEIMRIMSLNDLHRGYNSLTFDINDQDLVVNTIFCWEVMIKHNIYGLHPDIRKQIQDDSLFTMDDSIKAELTNLLITFLRNSGLILEFSLSIRQVAQNLNDYWLEDDRYTLFPSFESQEEKALIEKDQSHLLRFTGSFDDKTDYDWFEYLHLFVKYLRLLREGNSIDLTIFDFFEHDPDLW